MPISVGTRIGVYEIVAAIGAGGMGEVYRARDQKLNRDVALKVLPELFAGDSERLARFRREAQLLAALNHPNIAHIHGFEDADASTSSGRQVAHALVMEFVPGVTLAERIAAGPIPLDESLALAQQVASALEAAHAQSIVHRDLKPANIKISDDGVVKVLDFGLAKALDTDLSGAPATSSPTITSPAMTRAGLILGMGCLHEP